MRQGERVKSVIPVARSKKNNISIVKNDADQLLRVRQDKKSRVKNGADLLLRVR